MTPQVPIIQDSEQLQTGVGRQRVHADPAAFGAAEAQGTAALGRGLKRVEDTLGQIDDEFNEADARALDNELATRVRERLYNQENGYLSTQRGLGAIDGRAQAEGDVDAMAAEIAQRARSPRSRAMFEQVARQRVQSTLGDIASHAARETQSYQNEVSESRLTNFTDSAVAAFGDPVAVQGQIDGAIGEIQSIGTRLGWSPEVTQQRIHQFRSDVMARVIVQLATTDPDAAEEMFAQSAATGTFTAQDLGQLRTGMRAAQAQALERVEGAVWQALANGQNPRTLPEWREFSTNPLFGQAHERYNEYIRNRARAAAEGEQARSGGPAYMAGFLEADRAARGVDSTFIQPGHLEAFVAERAGELTPTDIRALFERRLAILGRSENAQDVQDSQRVAQINGELARIAQSAYGARLGYDAGQGQNGAALRARNDAFEASLARETQRWLAENEGRRPQGQEIQIVIGRAIVGMNDADIRAMPQFRVAENAGRTGTQARGREYGTGRERPYALTVHPSTEVVVPYADMDPGLRRDIEEVLVARLHRRPTYGEVENAYAASLQGTPLSQVIRAPGAR